MSAEGAVGALAGVYNENTDAVKRLAEQIKSWSGSYSKDALNQAAEPQPAGGMAPPPSGGGPSSPARPMSSSNNPNRWSAIGGAFGTATKIGSMLGNYGSNQLNQQVALNTYAQFSSYMGNAPTKAVIQQAVGTGTGSYRNNIANGTADAAAQFNILQQASGTELLNATPLGRAMRAASFTAGTINPGLGGQGSAKFAAQVYSPTTSLYMRQFPGLAPMSPYAQSAQSLPDIARGILSTMLKGGTISDKGFPQLMRQGGAGQLSYQFVTGGQIPLEQMQPIMQVVNKLQNQGVSNQQADWALNNSGQGNAKADAFLKQHIGTTDLMQMREAQSANMARTGDQYSPYTEGLSMATTAVGFFNTEFAKYMKHIGFVTGLAAGSYGTLSALEPGLTKQHYVNARGKRTHNARGSMTWGDGWKHSGQAPVRGAINVRGGGAQNPLRNVQGLRPERIDMGVDYAGSGPIMAIVSGTITNLTNSGWPGGAFISELMDAGPYAGHYWYVAENVTPTVQIGQHVDENTQIGILHNAFPNTEIGFAAPPGTGSTMAATSGQAGGPGHSNTAFGKLASDWLVSLGAPAGILNGPVVGDTKGFAAAPGGAAPATPGGGTGGGTGFYPMGNTDKRGHAPSPGTGDNPTGGSMQEKAAFLAAIMGGAHGGSGYYGNNMGTFWAVQLPGSPGGTTPAAAPAGGTPGNFNLSGNVTPTSWAQALLSALGDPVGGGNTAALVAWENAEGGNWHNSAHFNPLNTTQSAGSNGSVNSVGVKSYPDWNTGMKATIDTLNNGRYGPILAALKDPNLSAHALSQAVTSTPWGTVGFAAKGGDVPAGQEELVGERGPELVVFKPSKHHNTPCASEDFAYSTRHPVYAGGRDLLPSNTKIILRFKAKSVEFNVPASAQEDVSSSNNTMMARAEQLVNIHTLHSMISKGVK